MTSAQDDLAKKYGIDFGRGVTLAELIDCVPELSLIVKHASESLGRDVSLQEALASILELLD